MAKATVYKIQWIKCALNQEWEVEKGWEVVSCILYAQDGGVLMILRGDGK